MLPEVIALLLPEAHEKIPNYLDSFPYFEKLFVIDTDRNKTQQYIQNKERSSLKNQATNLNEYLISLGTKVTLRNVKVEDIERVHQLFSKTNQFNLTTIRYQLSDIEMFIADMSYDLYCFSVEDKFGDLGTVGIVLIHRLNGIAEIDSFTMSCRAMGRGIENSIVNWLKEYFFTVQNFAQITATYISTKKNIPIKNFLPEQGFKQEYEENDKVYYSLKATELQFIQCGWIELILEV
jgi:FkbH-like protein